MAYQALSRKYRPQKFSQVIGQDFVVKTLKNAIKLNRISHAYIFAGSRGIGKTTIARILTKVLNCKNPQDFEPCNECENCIQINKGAFPDLYEIDAASNRGIDDIRNIKENINYAPVKGNYKVYIIDEAHMLTREAFNALLKTLEEPPPRNIFILATTELHKIPETIKSRCQIFLFKPPTINQIKDYLRKILENENIPYEEEALNIIAQASEGGVRDSASLLDQAITFSEGKLTTKAVEQMLGIIPTNILNEVVENLHNLKAEEVIKTIENLDREGYDLNLFFKQLISKFEEILIDIATRKETNFNIDTVIYIQNILTRAYIEARNFINPKPIYNLNIAKLKYINNLKSISEVIDKGIDKTVEKQKINQEINQVETKPEEKFNLQAVLTKIAKEEPVIGHLIKKINIEEKEDRFIFHLDETTDLIKEKLDKIQTYFPKKIEIIYKKEEKKEKKKKEERDEAVSKILNLFPGSKIIKEDR
ncbi:DNA polymerase III subunit gamma/tau [Venenivibrio stagnispumantis]|uniref:DNA polymerase III subunit gamma/tau n=1 Tax=Venenivibrio stagnispumantis TaxID=407998 RepID=A0AA45WIN1_9AQUI|nr:DNA polymerase III subunit gamma/tau [Venenivibrio stagnispumantis]MCW4572645.1 DNA polymerase III subunit gamma/tau [Venenivibrio stagnispumantis]SMP00729.1 DNA polymerase-3 subunit gamma/tau [Venenivibrio stagnispumantis]